MLTTGGAAAAVKHQAKRQRTISGETAEQGLSFKNQRTNDALMANANANADADASAGANPAAEFEPVRTPKPGTKAEELRAPFLIRAVEYAEQAIEKLEDALNIVQDTDTTLDNIQSAELRTNQAHTKLIRAEVEIKAFNDWTSDSEAEDLDHSAGPSQPVP